MSFFVPSFWIASPDTSPIMFASTYSLLPILILDYILCWLYMPYSVLVIWLEAPESAIHTSSHISVQRRAVLLVLEMYVMSVTSFSAFVSEVKFALSPLFSVFLAPFYRTSSLCIYDPILHNAIKSSAFSTCIIFWVIFLIRTICALMSKVSACVSAPLKSWVACSCHRQVSVLS